METTWTFLLSFISAVPGLSYSCNYSDVLSLLYPSLNCTPHLPPAIQKIEAMMITVLQWTRLSRFTGLKGGLFQGGDVVKVMVTIWYCLSWHLVVVKQDGGQNANYPILYQLVFTNTKVNMTKSVFLRTLPLRSRIIFQLKSPIFWNYKSSVNTFINVLKPFNKFCYEGCCQYPVCASITEYGKLPR